MDEQRSVILCTGHVLLNVFLCSSYVRTAAIPICGRAIFERVRLPSLLVNIQYR